MFPPVMAFAPIVNWIDPDIVKDGSTSTSRKPYVRPPPTELEALDSMIIRADDTGEWALHKKLMAARKELVANLPPPAPSVRTEVRFVEGLCKVKVHVEAREHEVPEAPSWILRAFERIGGLPM